MSYTYSLAPPINWQSWQQLIVNISPTVYQFVANIVTDTITCETDPHYYTGQAVIVASTGTLPDPLNASVTYYIIVVSENNYRLALTYNDALSNIYVALTTTGTSTQSITTAGQVYLKPLANGKIYTYSSEDHSVNKPTFTDWTGQTQNPNPIILDNKGMARIYWEVNSLDSLDNYFLIITDANDVQVDEIDNYNAVTGGGSGPTPPVTDGSINHCRNPMFTFWDLYDYPAASNSNSIVATTMPADGFIETANEWFFTKNNNNATDLITIESVPEGDTEIPNNPTYYLQHECTSAGAGGETEKYYYQTFEDARTFSGQSIMFTIYLASGASSTPITISAVQHFGDGGSSDNLFGSKTVTVTDTFAVYDSGVINVPSVGGKDIRDGSYFAIKINLPLNATVTLKMCRAQLTISDVVQPFQQLTIEEQKNTLTTVGQTSEIKILSDQTAGNLPRCWIPYRSDTIGNPLSNATGRANTDTKSLFLFYWTTYSDVICPVYTSAGVKTVRGATAEIDFDANFQIAQPQSEGRAIVNVGTNVFNFTFTAAGAVLAIDPIAALNIYAGTMVELFTTNTLPGGLSGATPYYMIPVTSGTYHIAETFADAIAGTPYITTTDAGTGIHTMKWIDATFVNGQFFGEGSHAQTNNEVGSHLHNQPNQNILSVSTGGLLQFQIGGDRAGEINPNTALNTTAPTPMNIRQPSLVLPYIVKL